MNNDKFKAFAFQLTTHQGSSPLAQALKQIQSDSIENRVRNIAFSDIRVEHIQFINGLWFLDFVKFREVNGPGKGSKDKPIQGFSFAQGETFCEEAALMIDLQKGNAVIQYNHHGVRHLSMETYLSNYMGAGDIYSVIPIYDKNIDSRFNNRKSLQAVKIKIAKNKLSAADKQANRSLASALSGLDDSAEYIEISLSVGNSKKKKLSSTSERIADEVMALSQSTPDAVKKLEAKIIENNYAKQTVLDLIEQRISETIHGLNVGPDKRWNRGDRYRALQQAYQRWIKAGKI